MSAKQKNRTQRIAADTRFLFSLYGDDAHTARARRENAGWQGAPIFLSPFNFYELGNAWRLAVFRGMISVEDLRSSQEALAADEQAGFLKRFPCDAAEVLRAAARLSEANTISDGHRAFDILHVAAALVMGARVFLSFDANQRRLAAGSGLAVGPVAGDA